MRRRAHAVSRAGPDDVRGCPERHGGGRGDAKAQADWRQGVNMKYFSVVIPVYNELDAWKELVARVQAVRVPGLTRQIVLVEDGSKDGTRKQLEEFAATL